MSDVPRQGSTMPLVRADKHTSAELLLDRHARQAVLELGEALAQRRGIYLDMNYWIKLRDASQGKGTATGRRLLAVLRRGVEDGVIFCPISEGVFLELMKQEDLASRLATAGLIDELSLGATLALEAERISTEIRYFLNWATRRSDPHPWSTGFGVMQSSFRLAARRRPAHGGSAFTAPVTESWIGRNCPPPWDSYGRCIAGRRRWRGPAGAVPEGWGPPTVGGDGREGSRAARREDRRRTSTAPVTPGAAEAGLAEVFAPVTTNPEWPDTPRRRRGGRSVACCLPGSGDTGARSGRSVPHNDPDSQ